MKILVIEDDRFFQHFYSTKLAEQGFEVMIAGDGESGIEQIQSFQPNLILLDIIMPRKNGFEVLEFLRTNPTLSQIPVLVFSTLGQESDVKRAISLGARDYVNKSFFDFENLMNKIKSLIQPAQ